VDQSFYDRSKALFSRARGLAPTARDELLASECDEDGTLRRFVESLLAAHDSAQKTSIVHDEDEISSTSLKVGDRVGPYQVLDRIGEGGMGTVYLAEQREPILRRVALKVLRPGMNSEVILKRFDAERQALALMDHPSIAKVFDAGQAANGLPFFTMEWVHGEPITTYCDRHRLSTRERLRLFARVCEAVQHAHQKGVIHRDLKPTNILVCNDGTTPLPKVIDFGIAKAIATPLIDSTLYTRVGELLGTPEYMSPEQADVSTVDVDTRTDIYSLGVVLYELLTGELPFTVRELQGAAIGEVRKLIQEQEPQKPSARISTIGKTATEVAARRRTETRALAKELREDLDWIVLKALEKLPSRRYESASAFSADVSRYLGGDPVVAGPPSASYRVRKFIQRHRVGVGVAMSFVMAAAVALASLSWALVDSNRQRARTERALSETTIAQEQNSAVRAFLTGVLQEADPDRSGRSVTVEEALDRATDALDSKFTDAPAIAAEIQSVIGETYSTLGNYDRAIELLTTSMETRRGLLGVDDSLTLSTQMSLANTYMQSFSPEALVLAEDALQKASARFGKNHRLTVEASVAVANNEDDPARVAEMESLLLDALEGAQAIHDPEAEAFVLGSLGIQYISRGRPSKSIEYFEKEREISLRLHGERNTGSMTAAANLAVAYTRVGRFDEAESVFVWNLEVQREVLGVDHPATNSSLYHFGTLLIARGRLAEAEDVTRTVLRHYELTYGRESFRSYGIALRMAQVLSEQGKLAEAKGFLQRGLDGYRPTQETWPGYAGGLIVQGKILIREDRLPEAEKALAKAVELIDGQEGLWYSPSHRIALRLLADVCQRLGKGQVASALRAKDDSLPPVVDR
jgi:serine/threonine protein kinase